MTDCSLLVTGDLHLGRHPARVPEELDGRQLSPATVWEATVEAAIDRDVDAVLVSGDVVDRENRYVEAYGDFERGARRLVDAEIPLIAVAGNHDHDALPELVDSLDRDGVDLLGADGSWERRAVERDGEPVCYVDGWSFPSEHVLANPLDDYEPASLDAGGSAAASGSRTDSPVIGLLHADLDGRDSRYAPVATADLRDEPADAWVLGHVHAPGVRAESDPLVLYPGSPQPLDPGESGAHGPWLLSAESLGSGADVAVEQCPLATLRYDDLAVDVAGADATTDVAPAVRSHLEDHLREAPTGALGLLLARVRLTGRTEAHGDIADQRADVEAQLGLRREGLDVRVASLAVDTRPAVDLAALAGGDTPVAHLAELLLALEDANRDGDGSARERDDALDAEHEALVEDALDRMREAYGASAYARLHREDRVERPERADAVATLRRQARLLLDELLEQGEDAA